MSASISGWVEVILLSLVFVSVMAVLLSDMNINYGQHYILPIQDNSTENLFIEYQDTASQTLEGGEVQFDASAGVVLKESWGVMMDLMKIVWTFISGGWIENIGEMINAGAGVMIVMRAFRILFFISLITAALYALFKVVV